MNYTNAAIYTEMCVLGISKVLNVLMSLFLFILLFSGIFVFTFFVVGFLLLLLVY